MINLSKSAAEKVSDIFREQASVGAALRVFVTDGGNGAPQYGMAIEPSPSEKDEVIETEGVRVVVDEDSLPWVIGAEIDYIESVLRSGFTIRNPNFMGGGCACGGGGCACGGGATTASSCACGNGAACSCGAGH